MQDKTIDSPNSELDKARARLREFIKNSSSLASTMGSAAKVLELKLEGLKKGIDLPKPFRALAEESKTEWMSFLKKTIQHCRAIESIPNPYPLAKALVKKDNFTLEDYAEAIDSIYHCSLDANHNQALRTRAVHCLWLTLFFTILAKSPLEIKNLNDLITAFQRITRLGLFTEAGIDNNKKLTDKDSSPLLDKITSQLLALDHKSKFVRQIANIMHEGIDNFMKELQQRRTPSESISCFFALEPVIHNFIKSINDLIFVTEEHLEKGSLLNQLQQLIEKYFLSLLEGASTYFNKTSPSNRSIATKEILYCIRDLYNYGKELSQAGEIRGDIAVEHSKKLYKMIYEANLDQMDQPSFIQFAKTFREILHEKDSVLLLGKDIGIHSHRQQWKPILANIALALTGIGLIFQFGKLLVAGCSSKPLTVNRAFFFMQTQREQNLDAVEEAFDEFSEFVGPRPNKSY